MAVPTSSVRPDPWASFSGLRSQNTSRLWPTTVLSTHQPQSAKCNFAYAIGDDARFVGGVGKDYVIEFVMHTSPFDPCLQLRLRVKPNNKDDARGEISLWFRQLVDEDRPDAYQRDHRQVPLLGSNDPVPSTMPRGPLSFSSSIINFEYSRFPDSPMKDKPFKEQTAGKEHFFGWTSRELVPVNLACAIPNPDTCSNEARIAVAAFRNIAQGATSKDGVRIRVHTDQNPRLSASYYSHFIGLPFPRPHSYWPWLRETQGDEVLIDTSGSRGRWAQDPQFVDYFFSERGNDPILQQNANGSRTLKPPTQPLNLRTMPSELRFRDQRQYQAYILGCYVAESLDAQARIGTWHNGVREFFVIPKASAIANAPDIAALMLCRLRAADASTDSVSPDGTFPAVGEPVNLADSANNVNWNGNVVQIPRDVPEADGFTTAVLVRTTRRQGYVITSGFQSFDATFGHQGRRPVGVQHLVNQVMQATFTAGDHLSLEQRQKNCLSGIKTLLLARNYDNQRMNEQREPFVGGLTGNWQQMVRNVCASQRLNAQQKDVVETVFGKHRVVIINAPPGTGKTQVAKALMLIAEEIGHQYLFVAGSNQAVEVGRRRRGATPGEPNFRIYTAVQEGIQDVDNDPIDFSGVPPLPGENSLEETIRMRTMAARTNTLTSRRWNTEIRDLQALARVRDALQRAGSNQNKNQEAKLVLDLKRKYAQHAKGNMSTNAGVITSILRDAVPKIIIQDEGSQILEAEAVAPLSRFAHTLQRVVMFGDVHQLPPTVLGENNVFASQGKLSLFERLSKAGARVIRLTTQYRMHAHISSWARQNVYPDLQDAPGAGETLRSREMAGPKWDRWLKSFMESFRLQLKASPRRSVVFSSVGSGDSKLPFGSKPAANSHSLFNLTNAAIDVLTAVHLVDVGKFKAEDVMILAPYTAQVDLVRRMVAVHSSIQNVQVRSWDASQGDEADIVIVDFVRTTTSHGLGFLTDIKRLNVALTRAKCGRIIVGQSTIAKNRFASSGTAAIKNLMDDHHNQRSVYDIQPSMIDGLVKANQSLRVFEDPVNAFIKANKVKVGK